MADIREALREAAIQIRDEHKLGANTAKRVGSLLLALVDAGVNIEELRKFFLSKDQADTAQEIITFLKGLLIGNKGHGITLSASGVVTAILDELKNVFSIVSSGFVSGDLGNGFILKYDPETGRSYFEVDELLVRKIAYFVELVIKQLRHVGGEIILTPASMTCIKVEELADVYRCYFQADDGTKSVMQEFEPGDQARCQTFNIKPGTSHNVTNKYYWRLVTAVGDDYIDLSKTDCDTGSGIPASKDNIVQLGNRTAATRQNAIILSTVGDDAPSIKQYKGINGYTLAGKEVTILSATLNKFIGRFVSEVTGRSYDDLMSELQADMEVIRTQTDKEYTLWFFEYDPGLDNLPASDWTTAELKAMHEQDMFYNRTTGHAWRFEKNADGSFSWNGITDQLTLKALENAAKAQDTADGKRRVFVEQPTDAQAYEVGDQWVNAIYTGEGVTYKNDSLVCKTAKAAGAPFSIAHWQPTSAATTARIENLGDEIRVLVEKLSFDAEGNVTNISTSGLVTENNFASLFSKQVTADGLVKSADIRTFITEDRAGELISQAEISADQIRFNGNIVANDTFVVDTEGNLTLNKITVNGEVYADKGNLAGWKIETDNIRKNNVVFGSDGSIYNSNGSWYLGNDDTGYLADNKIQWKNGNLGIQERVTVGVGKYENFKVNPYVSIYANSSDAGISIMTLDLSGASDPLRYSFLSLSGLSLGSTKEEMSDLVISNEHTRIVHLKTIRYGFTGTMAEAQADSSFKFINGFATIIKL